MADFHDLVAAVEQHADVLDASAHLPVPEQATITITQTRDWLRLLSALFEHSADLSTEEYLLLQRMNGMSSDPLVEQWSARAHLAPAASAPLPATGFQWAWKGPRKLIEVARITLPMADVAAAVRLLHRFPA